METHPDVEDRCRPKHGSRIEQSSCSRLHGFIDENDVDSILDG